jgi:SH3-like domain-containing protein
VVVAEAAKASPPKTVPSVTEAAKPAPPAPSSEWKSARTIASGRTNVRGAPAIDAKVVAQLDPGVLILVQATSSEWWKARATKGAGFIGYIRRDRLVFP